MKKSPTTLELNIVVSLANKAVVIVICFCCRITSQLPFTICLNPVSISFLITLCSLSRPVIFFSSHSAINFFLIFTLLSLLCFALTLFLLSLLCLLSCSALTQLFLSLHTPHTHVCTHRVDAWWEIVLFLS